MTIHNIFINNSCINNHIIKKKLRGVLSSNRVHDILSLRVMDVMYDKQYETLKVKHANYGRLI